MCFEKLISFFKLRYRKGDNPEVLSDEQTEAKKTPLTSADTSEISNTLKDRNNDSDDRTSQEKRSETDNKQTKKLLVMNQDEIKGAPEFEYLEKLIQYRIGQKWKPGEKKSSEEHEGDFNPVKDFPLLETWLLPFKKFADENGLSELDYKKQYKKQDELTLLLVGLIPHLKPDLFDRCISEIINGSDFPNIGGVRGKNCRFFLPTGETALFLLADDDVSSRQQVQKLFWSDHLFGNKKILWLEDLQQGEPLMSGRIIMSQDYIDLFTHGRPVPPHFSMSFPATLIQTELTWNDLVIDKELQQQIRDIVDWLQYNDQLMNEWGMKNRLKKGYRTLFYGPPGTGKTFTAGLLGKYTGRKVYKIDLSMVVSKYIGETEKNLELLFARAEDKGWILFFDEADALFGKRTNVRDAHDKYANQEVSYLLQRIEDYNGLIILATNMKSNIDDAFIRRFNSIVKFSFPDAAQRALIWKKSLPQKARFKRKPATENNFADNIIANGEKVDIAEAVKKYELTGGNILNVVHYAGIKAVERLTAAKAALHENINQHVAAIEGSSDEQQHFISESPLIIYLTDVQDGIRREMIKEGKPFSL